ncbi:hypothetical protein [Flavobacterium chungbukense]|uniref:Fungal lipase-like domain-containing protein n=1 Tax=Flavobacterium chungbukense TaxID=877464 RepID=A0ABP7XU55_9FLAO|nr:hypothetical protein [Flavobacterium chungbukense]MCC4921312.1 hypothetical protein [Flavobacterium chungbukense]
MDNVTVPNNYKGPSKIPQGVVIDNMTLYIDNSSNNTVSTGTNSSDSLSWYAMPLHGSATKPTILEAALMSKSVYGGKDLLNSNDLMGWKVSQPVEGVIYDDPVTGFKSVLYERMITGTGEKQYCYVTAGTEPGDYGDYAADVLQTIGVSKQYYQSTENAKILKAIYGDQLSFAGHSLGGGMAEANARMTGESATTFNAAGLSYATVLFLGTGLVSDTHSYIMHDDPLNLAQTSISGLTTAGGQKHFVSANGSEGGYSIDAMISSLKVSQNIK